MCRSKHVLGACVALATMAGASGFAAQGESRKSALTIEQLIEIKHPSDRHGHRTTSILLLSGTART